MVNDARPAGLEGDTFVERVLVGVLVEVGGRWRAAGGGEGHCQTNEEEE